MKLQRVLISGLILGTWLCWAALAGAAPSAEEGPAGFEDLNLTREQQQALQELQNRFRQEIDQIRKKIMALRLELRTLSLEDRPGPKGQEIRTGIRELSVSGREKALFYQQEAWKLLKEEQREKISPGNDLGFRCHFGGFMGRGPGRKLPRGPGAFPAGPEIPPLQP
jgi:Spy/CpxP family protein refolding chaperone